jgi:hypothetical protein
VWFYGRVPEFNFELLNHIYPSIYAADYRKHWMIDVYYNMKHKKIIHGLAIYWSFLYAQLLRVPDFYRFVFKSLQQQKNIYLF